MTNENAVVRVGDVLVIRDLMAAGTLVPNTHEGWAEALDVYAVQPDQATSDAALLAGLLSHCWDFKTSFDRQGEPSVIRATFKISTITSTAMQESARKMIRDFVDNVPKEVAHDLVAATKGGE